MNSQPVLDGLDTDILTMIASGPLRQLQLARRLGVASLTVKRRVTRLVSAGMVSTDTARRFCITKTGVAALGGDTPSPKVEPWLKVSAVSAASARDVVERNNDDRSVWAKSRHGTEARVKAAETMASVSGNPSPALPPSYR